MCTMYMYEWLTDSSSVHVVALMADIVDVDNVI